MRERTGRFLVVVGVVSLVVSLGVVGASAALRDTDSIRRAAPTLLEVQSVRAAVKAELGRSITEAYAPVGVDEATLEAATERMVDNGYVNDDFQVALDAAHRRWLDGADLIVVLDPNVVTQAALGGLRDADLAVAQAFPDGTVLRPAGIPMPVERTAVTVEEWGGNGLAAAGISVVVVLIGAVFDPRRSRSLRSLARGTITAGLLLASMVLIVAVPALRDLNDLVAVIAALTALTRIPLLVGAAVLVFIGLWLHASADRLVSTVERRVGSIRHASPSPVASGTGPKRTSVRRRSEAIDAFFGPEEATDRAAPGTAVIDARDPEEAGVDLVEDGDPPEDPADAPAPAAKTPEQERAEALAAERREALERIDGKRGRYRTYLRR